MNNFEKIKQMTIDEMAEWIKDLSDCDCRHCPVKSTLFFNCEFFCTNNLKRWLEGEGE